MRIGDVSSGTTAPLSQTVPSLAERIDGVRARLKNTPSTPISVLSKKTCLQMPSSASMHMLLPTSKS